MTEIAEPTVHLCWNESAIRRAAEVLRAAHLDLMAADVEAHLTPTIEEPAEFGSIVRAKFGGKDADLWTNTPWHGEHYWRAEAGWSAVWPELTDVEVLRIGVGDEYNHLLQQMRDLLLRSPSGYLSTDETLAAYKDLRKGLSDALQGDL